MPVGLLSQVYEAFCWKWEDRTAKETSVYYTPRKIAQIIVDEAFDSLPNADEARVLDPACGAGVFLVLAFRRLYQERWKITNKRPDTKAIREILDNQLKGFDISSSALKLSALSLYLTAIELDPTPIPPEKLKFGQLNNKVLFNHRRSGIDPIDGPVIGCLGEHVGNRFDGQFDLVLSNPPWTSLSKEHKGLANNFNLVSKAIIERKGETSMAYDYQNPDFAPDMPILWKSTEWCKPGGRIAMALPARILLKQEAIPSRAREAMFRLIEVTGIINGSNLSDTEVWPEMSQPFLLFFTRNNRPNAGNMIHFITPQFDKVLNQRGEIRIDSKSSQSIDVEATFDDPWLWKALTVGTPLDVEVIRKIKSSKGCPLDQYWRNILGLVNGNGYQIAAGQRQKDSSFLFGLPDLKSTKKFRFEVHPDQLQPFNNSTLVRPRKREIYSAPLVLINVAPGEHREEGRALLSFSDVVYNESFSGYSGAGNPQGELLVRYLHLFIHSQIWIHYVLLTSSRFGTERRKIYKSDIDYFPIISLEELSSELKNKIQILSNRLLDNDMKVFGDIDEFFGSIYGLDKLDMEVIKDTLDVSLPYSESRERACIAPTAEEVETFRQRLEFVVRPFFKVLNKEPQITIWKPDNQFLRQDAPFGIIFVSERGLNTITPSVYFNEMILQLANDTGATRIIQHIKGCLIIGILRQYRYWTPSRARLLGAEIVRHYIESFEE